MTPRERAFFRLALLWWRRFAALGCYQKYQDGGKRHSGASADSCLFPRTLSSLPGPPPQVKHSLATECFPSYHQTGLRPEEEEEEEEEVVVVVVVEEEEAQEVEEEQCFHHRHHHHHQFRTQPQPQQQVCTFSKAFCIVPLSIKYARALTFENFCK